MNYQVAIKKVEEYLTLLAEGESVYARRRDQFSYLNDPKYKQINSDLNSRKGLIEQIANHVDDRIAQGFRIGARYGWEHSGEKKHLEELLGRLKGAEEEAAILGPSGPQLSVACLHRWVWSAAVELWDDGHYGHAVRAASGAVFDQHLPAKLDILKQGGATEQIGKAFSLKDPAPDEPRLRFTELAKGSDDWKSAHEGAAAFGRGCAMGIRNITTHGAEPAEQLALEALAALSPLARWIDEAEVERAP